jgi:DNA mismatch endonuclease (patch repair protein)
MDVLTIEQRRLNMSRIKGRDTKPELVLRRALHANGLRYRLHVKGLPGRPDLVFPQYKVATFVHGCFWHGHDCHLFKLPMTNRRFWKNKINGNRKRDEKQVAHLKSDGWRILTVWECVFKGPERLPVNKVKETCSRFIRSGNQKYLEISGVKTLRR